MSQFSGAIYIHSFLNPSNSGLPHLVQKVQPRRRLRWLGLQTFPVQLPLLKFWLKFIHLKTLQRTIPLLTCPLDHHSRDLNIFSRRCQEPFLMMNMRTIPRKTMPERPQILQSNRKGVRNRYIRVSRESYRVRNVVMRGNITRILEVALIEIEIDQLPSSA
jgi:hypothetical protein